MPTNINISWKYKINPELNKGFFKCFYYYSLLFIELYWVFFMFMFMFIYIFIALLLLLFIYFMDIFFFLQKNIYFLMYSFNID